MDDEDKIPESLRLKLMEVESNIDWEYPNWKRGITWGILSIFSAGFYFPLIYMLPGSEKFTAFFILSTGIALTIVTMIIVFVFGAFRPPRNE